MTKTSRNLLQSIGILFTATVAIAIGGVHYHVVGAMVRPLSDTYGWSRGGIAFALTISSFIHPFTNIVIGLLADRFSPRAIALPGIFGFGAGTALLGLVGGEIWTWYAGYIAFSILGAGASSIIYTKLVVQQFTHRRGLALATSLAGAGLLVSTIPSIVLALEGLVGLRLIYPVLGICAFLLMFPPAWLFLPRVTAGNEPVERAAKSSSQWREVIGSTILWRLVLCFFIVASCVGTFIVHLQPMLADAGLSRVDAAKVALFIGPAMIVGRLGTGALFDLLPTRLVASCAFSLPAFACLWIWLVPLDYVSATALAVLVGIGMGSEVDVVAYMSSRYFGMRRYGLVFAILISTYGFAVGTSSWVVGKVYDRFGTYDPALLVLMPAIAAAVVLVISLGRPPELDVDGDSEAG